MLASILPPVGSDKRAQWVVKTVVRRGQAYARLTKIDEAISDYTLAAGKQACLCLCLGVFFSILVYWWSLVLCGVLH